MLLINVANRKTLFDAVFIPWVTLVNHTFAVVYSHLCLCHAMQFIVKYNKCQDFKQKIILPALISSSTLE